MSIIIVTGAAGFIGSHLCESLLGRDHEVIALDDLSMGKLDNLENCSSHKGFSFHKVDITDLETVKTLCPRADCIVDMAAFKIPRYGNATKTLTVNMFGAYNMMELGRKLDAKVVIISTSDVYGKNPSIPFTEEHDCLMGPSTFPRWSYSVSKLFSEHMGFAYQASYGTPISIARFFGSYGPRHHLSWWGGPQSVFIDAVLRGTDIEIHGDGLQTRSFCYISDTIAGLIPIIESDKANGEIFNIGSVEEISIKDLAFLIKELSGTPGELKIRYVSYEIFGKYEDVRRRVPDITKASTILGYEPKVSLREGLTKTIEWQRGYCK